MFGRQSVQVELILLVSTENFPGAHSKHESDPWKSLYVPAMHAEHDPSALASPVHPALHVQAVKTMLCSGDIEFDGQASQKAVPGDCLYLPAAHCKHNSP